MVDTNWLLNAMSRQQLVVRLHITPGAVTRAEAHAFGYWMDDMAFNGYHLLYRYTTDHDRGIKPLEARALSGFQGEWPQYFEAEAEFWPAPWHLSEQIVCSIGTGKGNTRQLKVTEPQALIHLARFQGLVTATDPSVNPKLFVGIAPFWSLSLSDAAHSLDGIVNQADKKWREMIGQH